MPVQDVKYSYRVTIDGDDWRIAPDIQINESQDQLCTVAEFSIAARPSTLPQVGDSVLIELIDVSGGRAYPIFGGTVNVRRIQAQPWNYRITCCDQLEKLRRTRTTSDLNLTGMTDGEAWQAIADACDLDYDTDDIGSTTYELGAYVPIKWHADNQTAGAQLIQELDDVFGFKTLTVGDNRIIRIQLDETPADGDGLYRSYTKGINAEFISDTRTEGDRDQLQNAWRVTGVLDEISESCTAQVWAMAIAGSGYLASKRVRVGTKPFGSDLIQHESLALEIVKRLMRRTNKLPDMFAVRVLQDHQIHVGSKLRIVDTTKGIGASAGVYGMVRSLVRSGFWLDLEIIAGPGGDIGTVTSGVLKTCNKTTTDIDRPGDFTPPDFGYPPLIDGTDTDFDFPGGTDDDSGEIPPPAPVEDCTTDASFTSCDDDDSDFCSDGSTTTEDISGTSPADFCVTALNAYRLQTKSFSSGGVGFSTQCQVHVPWREVGGTGTAYYHVDGSGAVDYVQTMNGDTTAVLIANSETDPDLQTVSTDTVFASPLISSITGTVVFNVAGSVLTIGFYALDGDGDATGDGAYMTIYADPGLTVSPSFSDTDYVFGVKLNGCAQGPILVGDALPNTSFGATKRNNGGYVASSPAALGVPVTFTMTADETRKFGWGWTFANTDLGSGYMDHNDFLNQAHGPFPGEPSMPTDTCADDHTNGHVCIVTMNPGGAGTEEAPAIRLYGLVVGHTTCTANPSYAP